LLGIQEVAGDHGYLISVSSSEGSYEVERRIVEQCTEREVDGLIITPILSDDVDLSHLFELKRHGAPFVLLEEVRGIRAHLVDVDNVKASGEAVKFLIDQGHSLIVHFAGPKYSEHTQERADGVRRAFSESHLRFDEAMIVHAGASPEDGYRVGLEYFGARREDRATAHGVRRPFAFPVSGWSVMLAWSTACARGAPRPVASVTRAPFGTTDRGESVSAYTLKSANGMEARVLDYGGIVVSVRVPDRHGRFDDVVLGYDSLADYLRSSPYFGAIIGRYGNRIAGGRFTLDGKTYTLAKNNGPNHLHGGLKGFDKVVWDAAPFQGA